MNIFVLHNDPFIAATYHCDKHVVKMIVETAQMLSTAASSIGIETMMKPCYHNHPCNVWARQSMENYTWLCNLGKALCKEHTFRYGKIHSLEDYMYYMCEYADMFPSIGLTKFALAMPDIYKCENAVKSYRDYYLGEKKKILIYRRRLNPHWI